MKAATKSTKTRAKAKRWHLRSNRFLTGPEIADVIADLRRKRRRSPNSALNLTIFRLSTCCGLRASEIGGLRLSDVRLSLAKPIINVPKAIAKLGIPRTVPLWWDAGTMEDLSAWKEHRMKQGAKPTELFVCVQATGRCGNPLGRESIRRHYRTGCRVLGAERLKALSVHDGRHSFISHALARGRTLAEVREAAGHTNVETTGHYLHVAVQDDGKVCNLFKFDMPSAVVGMSDMTSSIQAKA